MSQGAYSHAPGGLVADTKRAIIGPGPRWSSIVTCIGLWRNARPHLQGISLLVGLVALEITLLVELFRGKFRSYLLGLVPVPVCLLACSVVGCCCLSFVVVMLLTHRLRVRPVAPRRARRLKRPRRVACSVNYQTGYPNL